MKRRAAIGLLCPADAAHGPLLEIDGRLRCVHQEHDGRPKTHPLGYAPASPSRFSLDEVLTSTAADAPASPVSAAAGATARVQGDLPGASAARGSGGRIQEGLGL